MPLAETVTVVNRSGKVVKTSKHLVNVFKEAKSVYLERKAEIKAVRQADIDERDARRALDRLHAHNSDDEYESRASSPRSPRHQGTVTRKPVPKHDKDRSSRTHHSTRSPRHGRSSNLREDGLSSSRRQSPRRELVRRKTDGMLSSHTTDQRPQSTRSASMDDIDMSLAYGELPPPLPLRPRNNKTEADELRNKVSKLQALLDEANCAQHTVVSMIESLQKNPEQLAAVALTLAEISNLASKMAPGALLSLKNAAPAVIALLVSSEFMIAAGVGVGVTIIAFGGYKIIKRIRNKQATDKQIEDTPSDDELREIRSDLSRIDVWRRGIADAHADSVATSVDGEFITPVATKQLIDQGKLRESDLKSVKTAKSKKSTKDKSKKPTKDSSKRRDSFSDDSTLVDKGMALIRDTRSLFSKKEARKPETSK